MSDVRGHRLTTVRCETTGNRLAHLVASDGLALPSGYVWIRCRGAYHRGARVAGPPTCLWCVADQKLQR